MTCGARLFVLPVLVDRLLGNAKRAGDFTFALFVEKKRGEQLAIILSKLRNAVPQILQK